MNSELYKPLKDRDFYYICDFCDATEIDTDIDQARLLIVSHTDSHLAVICCDCTLEAVGAMNNLLKHYTLGHRK